MNNGGTMIDVETELSVSGKSSHAKENVEGNRDNSFPDLVMSGVAGDFSRLYSQYIEAPSEFLYFGFLSCLGSILAGKLTLQSEISVTTRLYNIFIGESGDARKSSSIKATIDFFNDLLPGKLLVCWGIGSAEGLQRELKNTPDGRLLLCEDEMKALISKCRIDGSVLLPCINSLFEQTHYQNATKSSQIILNDAHLSILGASTKDMYATIWTPQFINIGFLNRIFLIPGSGKRRFPIPKKIPTKDQGLLAEKVSSILTKVGSKLELNLTEKAEEEYLRWYLKIENSLYTKRLDTYALRFMPLLAINDGKNEIDLDSVKKVIAIMDWQKLVRQRQSIS